MAKKREDHSLDPGTFDSPFAGLTALKADLPAGDAAVESESDPAGATQPSTTLRVRKERKGRGGKTVTLIEGAAAEARPALAADIKRALGTGARVEGEAVVVQGDLVDRVRAFLADR